MRLRRIVEGVLLSGLSAAAVAGDGVWTSNGPSGGDAGFVVADASTPGTLVAASRGGVFRSSDGGVAWSRFEGGLAYQYPYALQAASSGVVFLAPSSNTLFRSQAGGAWMPTGFSLAADQFLFDLSLRAGSDQFIAAGTSAGLRLSNDGGATFGTPLATGLPSAGNILRVDYVSATRLFVAYDGAPAMVFRSDDGGASFSATGTLPGFSYLHSYGGDLETAPSDPDRVYFSASNTIYTSVDAGANWTECGPAGGGGQLRIDPADATRLWATGAYGLYASNDGCASWTALASGLSADGTTPDTTTALAFAPGFPGDARLWVGTPYGGVYRSSDAGASFVSASDGLLGTHIRAIAMHPTDPNQILLGYGDANSPSPALYRSMDAGTTWPRSNTGLRAAQIRGIAYDPTTAALPGGAHVYAVGRTRSDAEPNPLITDAGIYKSTDGGIHWSTIDNGIPNDYINGTRFIGTVRSVVLDPRSCVSPPASGACSSGPLQTLYVTASGRAHVPSSSYAAARVYKSTDAGASWSPRETGLPPPATSTGPGGETCDVSQIAVPLVVDPTDPQTLYLGLMVSYRSDTACPVPTLPNGVFKSSDGGATWLHSSTGLPTLGAPGTSQWNILALAIDPATPTTLYAGGYRDDAPDYTGGMFKSVDGGAHWTDISVGIAGADVRAILVDPNDSDVVYAGTGGSPSSPSGVFRSTDGGLTWNSFSIGLPADAATALALDPHDPQRLLAGTPGGLWEFTQVPDGDGDGAVTAIENAAPNGGDANADGIADAEEANVASFFGAIGGAPGKVGAKGAPLPAITLAVVGLAGNCARINNAHAIAGDRLPADVARGVAAADFDRGVLRFELPDCERARVTVTFHGADDSDVDWVWRNHGPLQPGDGGSFAWYTFAGAKKTAPDTWELTIGADERGNYRDDAGSILFVGAPGFVDIHLFGDGME